MKIFKHRNIMGCIYGLLLAIPLLSILVRSAYVIVNKNAYQSAEITQTTYNKVETQVPTSTPTDFDELVIFNYYYLNSLTLDNFADNQMLMFIPTDTFTFKVENVENQGTEEIYIDGTVNNGFPLKTYFQIYKNYVIITNYYYTEDTYITYYFESNDIELNGDIQITDLGLDDFYNYFDEEVFLPSNYKILNYEEIESTTLDNVFEYSIDKTIEENNFGKLNFFEWFTNLFVNDNEVNNRYVGYVNWYMNYVMLVSCAYILFLVLMWFINFSRRLLERGMNYDW